MTRLKNLLLTAGALALLCGTAQASGMPWGNNDMPWNGGNMPWSSGNHGWRQGGSMPWSNRNRGWRGRGGKDRWDDWMPWGSNGNSPWDRKGWGDMPWSNKRHFYRRPPYGYGYGQQPGYRMPRGQMMMPPRGPQGGAMPPRPTRPPQARPSMPRPPVTNAPTGAPATAPRPPRGEVEPQKTRPTAHFLSGSTHSQNFHQAPFLPYQ